VTRVTPGAPLSPLSCEPPDPPDNDTWDEAEYGLSGLPEDNFYRLVACNRNGSYYTQADGLTFEEGTRSPLTEVPEKGRTVHICWPAPGGDLEDPGGTEGTRRDCTPPTSTCREDGAPCDGEWSTPPRPLSECGGQVCGGEPTCGETPVFFGSEPRWRGFVPDSPIVFVQDEPPKFDLTMQLDVLHCLEETGADRLGHDEPMLFGVGVNSFDPVFDPRVNAGAWRGGGFDSGDTRVLADGPFALATVPGVAFNESVNFGLFLVERENTLAAQVIGVLVIGAATAVGTYYGGPYVAAAGAAVTMAYLLIARALGRNENLGHMAYGDFVSGFADRINISHGANFLVSPPEDGGELPPTPLARAGGLNRHVGPVQSLLHPNDQLLSLPFAGLSEPFFAECGAGGLLPGCFLPGEECYISRCVPNDIAGMFDPSIGVAFRERRDLDKDVRRRRRDARYMMDVRYELQVE